MAKEKQQGDFRKTISVCGKNRSSTWGVKGDKGVRSTTKGMRMVVTVSGKGSGRKSVTSFEAPEKSGLSA